MYGCCLCGGEIADLGVVNLVLWTESGGGGRDGVLSHCRGVSSFLPARVCVGDKECNENGESKVR